MKSVFITTLIAVILSPAARAGFDSGNAGDAFSSEFLFTGRDILQRLELLAANKQPLIETAKLRAAMEKTAVVSEDHVYLDGQERDAVNFPAQKLIKIGRERWKELRKPAETKGRLTLVLHEFLWMTGVDDTNFSVTQKVIDKLNVAPYSPAIWLSVPGRAFASAECTGQLKDGTFVTVTVATKGVTKSPDHAEVQIQRDGNKFGYRFKADEISQFFESDDDASGSAVVGVGAYVRGEFPISVKYVGPNFVDQDLKAVIQMGGQNPAGISSTKNFMLVWMGPGHESSEQYKITDPVCSISSDN